MAVDHRLVDFDEGMEILKDTMKPLIDMIKQMLDIACHLIVVTGDEIEVRHILAFQLAILRR